MKFLPLTILSCSLAICNCANADRLVLLHTNDTHSQIDPAHEDDLGGVARRKVLIDSIRAVEPNVVLIDAGDGVQGSLFFNLYKGEVEEKLFNALGYDIRILGNHEFDNGMQALHDVLQIAEAELLCSNYDFRGTPLDSVFKPYAIKEINGKKIAFMPINLQPKGMISARNTIGMDYISDVEAASHLAWILKNILHADLVVAITHLGYYDDLKLIEQSQNIDVLIGGHSHTLVNPDDTASVNCKWKNADGKDVVIGQLNKGGKYLGQINIDLDSIGKATPQSKIHRVDSHLDDRIDSSIENIINPYRAKVEDLYKKKVTSSPRFLDRESHDLLNLMADFVELRGNELIDGKVDLTIINKGGIRNNIEKGIVTEGDIITLMPFFNRLQVIEISGENLLKAFETMAKVGGNGVSKNVKAYFNPQSLKCTDVKIDGKEIDPNGKYIVATIDYLSEGGDYMESLVDHVLLAESPNYLFEDLLYYYRDGKGKGKKINPDPIPRMMPDNN